MGLDPMKEKDPAINLCEMAAIQRGKLGYQAKQPTTETSAIPQSDEPCDYSDGAMHRTNFQGVFSDLALPKHAAYKASVSPVLIRMIGNHLTRRAAASHE
jgi:hypothetical protein